MTPFGKENTTLYSTDKIHILSLGILLWNYPLDHTLLLLYHLEYLLIFKLFILNRFLDLLSFDLIFPISLLIL